MRFESKGNTLLCSLPQRIDSTNAAGVENEIKQVLFYRKLTYLQVLLKKI